VRLCGISRLTKSISIGEDEATGTTLECVCVPDGLIEETWHTNIETTGAAAIHNKIRISYVVPVIGAVKISAVPARGEHQFETDSISAVGIEIRLVRKEVSVEGSFRVLAIVQAVESERSLGEIVLASLAEGAPKRFLRVRLGWITSRVSAALGVTSNHAESRGEGSDIISVEQIVAVRSY
jgi:hypothetical protein